MSTKPQEMELDNVPLSGKCSFRAMVLTDGYTYKWSNYETCTRNLSLSGIAIMFAKYDYLVNSCNITNTCM